MANRKATCITVNGKILYTEYKLQKYTEATTDMLRTPTKKILKRK